MGTFLIPIVIAAQVAVIVILLRLVKGHILSVSLRASSNQSTLPCARPDLSTLNCRVRLVEQNQENCAFDAFIVEICGSICAPDDTHNTTVQITIADLTDGPGKAKPVHGTAKRWQRQDSSEFYYKADLGRLSNRGTILSDWMAVAQLNLEWLILPRKGKRNLQFTTSILSRQNGGELACARCTFIYENSALGYIDLEENIRRTRMLAVTLAFAVSASDNKLFDCEIELIKSWARENVDVFKKARGGIDASGSLKSVQTSGRAKRELEKVLNKAVVFFRKGNKVDTYKICKEMVEIVSLSHRYDVLELCLRVVQAKGVAAAEELALLKNLAKWLEVDTNRFRTMTERILPANIHQVEDKEIILGITADMSEEQTREHLNKEYRKWNARVTSSNPDIQLQADCMLEFIAEARKQYVR